MALKVGDAVISDPVRDDIVRAVDLAPHGARWRLTLDNGQDDHIEAVTGADGGFKVTFVDRGSRLDADEPMDPEALKSLLSNYLDGDTNWRDGIHLVGQKGNGSRQRAARRISSKPPALAIVAVALAFFGSPFVLYLLPEAETGSSRIFPILWIVAGPASVMLIAMIFWKTLQFRRARQWPSAPGRITRSEVSASHLQSEHEATRIVNLPTIEYDFSFNGQKYTGRRIGIGEDSGGANIEQTLARYPLGASVTVYCDPDDPENCVLERNAPSFMPAQGCATTLASSGLHRLHYLLAHHALRYCPGPALGHRTRPRQCDRRRNRPGVPYGLFRVAHYRQTAERAMGNGKRRGRRQPRPSLEAPRQQS